ncbi:MAG TPA: beta-ketoacyl synthase N-terminal-like domain-containing protein [Polyangiaceae bacterium LLY-WYZ-15_(1-7)]|mgnify:CR=1 FL=1|nr:hypothetical protein [Myxococcales bacterium]MAT27076.1 hypothetical protein [Sandaracinus sp.]HJL00299.1 beta-ketoacyl synthase N-terminal-like domain-containing protein [Polyangiaceae bacterium LLY-WYZ-15_(1-7)]HJL06851.1 beta-ketoacyl synthase N-terminal-like domain-containing protein [Polyangiaceae bacterium LLY-WYZ-15_(1-7)]HJL36218.1 beta-ketoacyl synthase N-terminal-like domain-containing protein [Polyangiaceae bacterium LLY-WYZ-15_(1-7)]
MELAITGLGAVSPFGVGREAWCAALAEGEGARAKAFREGPSEVLEGEAFADARTAEVWGWDPKAHLGKRGHRSYDRLTKFLIAAAKHALADAGVKVEGEFAPPLGPEKVGICSATAYGSLDAITELNRVAELENPRYLNPTRFPNTVINAAAGYVSIWEDLRAPNTTVVDGNCGALDAVLTASTHLEHGRGEAFLVGGGEVVSEPLYLALKKLGVLADGRTDGQGVEMGEGAAYVVVEKPEAAAARGATVHARIRGYGTAFEPPESEALLVHCGADAVERAARMALSEAGVAPEELDAVVTATGGIGDIDGAEMAGLKRVFGEGLAYAPTKRLQGETFGAAGAFGLASVLAWMGGAPVAPVGAGAAPEKVGAALVSTVGFYGNVSCVVVTR